MKILCSGLMRSGSTWSYNVVRLIFKKVNEVSDSSLEVIHGYKDGERVGIALDIPSSSGQSAGSDPYVSRALNAFARLARFDPEVFGAAARALGRPGSMCSFNTRDIACTLNAFARGAFKDRDVFMAALEVCAPVFVGSLEPQ